MSALELARDIGATKTHDSLPRNRTKLLDIRSEPYYGLEGAAHIVVAALWSPYK